MDVFYWGLIGLLVALVAKVQLPTEREENMPILAVAAVAGAIAVGLAVHTIGRSGFLGMSWVSHVCAFIAAMVAVLSIRVATKQHLA